MIQAAYQRLLSPTTSNVFESCPLIHWPIDGKKQIDRIVKSRSGAALYPNCLTLLPFGHTIVTLLLSDID